MKRHVAVGRVSGVPVHVHWSVVAIAFVMVGSSVEHPGMALVAVTCYLGVLLLHEWGHMAAAHRKGLTVWSIELYPFHGRTMYAASARPYDTCVVAWAGVVAQLVVAVPIVAWLVVVGFTRVNAVNAVLALFGYFSAFIAALNLLPIPPLDGATAWRIIPLLWRRKPWRTWRSATRSPQARKAKGPWVH
jgi:Zn-dependent protease